MRFETNLSAQKLELRTGSYESLTGRIVFEFLEVVDEHFSKLGGFNSPFFSVGVSVAGIEDLGIYAGKFGGNGEVKDRKLLGGGGEDRTVEDSVDDTAGVLDRDTLAGTVPASVYEISLRTALFHLLHEFFSIFGGVERKERCTEAS